MGGTPVSKALVAYFSPGGNTRRAAKMLAAAARADIIEIKPAEYYTHADLNWMNKFSRSTLEMKDPSSRPEIMGPLPDLHAYDTVLLGFPIWWYTCPAIIRTFLDEVDTIGRKIIPFATSGGSGLGNAAKDLKHYAPMAEILPGRMMNGRLNPDELTEWVEAMGL